MVEDSTGNEGEGIFGIRQLGRGQPLVDRDEPDFNTRYDSISARARQA